MNRSGDMPVHIAANYGREEITVALITEFCCDPNIANSNDWTLLHYACKAGNVSLVRTLIEHKADITAKNNQGDMPVHIAADYDREEVIFALITEFGCDTNIADSNGSTLLHYACKAGNVSLVQTLIEHKADITVKNNRGDMPVHIAADYDREEVILALITEFGCDTNIAGSNGWTLLHYACKEGNVNLVRTFIEHKADITAKNNQSNMPVHIAVKYNRGEVILALITEFGCDTNIADSNGSTLLHYACKAGNVSLVRTLIEHKADITAKNNQGNMPVHIAANYGREEITVALITEFCCDPNIANSNDWTLLHYACKAGNVSLVRTLIEHKADITAKNNQGDIPVHIAANYGREEITVALITEFCCDPNIANSNDWTLLHYACKAGNVSLVRTLIEHKADITAKNNQGDMPVHIAADYDKEEVTLALITEFGCDPNMKGSDGQSLLHYACKRGNISLVQTLVQEHRGALSTHALPLVFDDDGNTPLHVCSSRGHSKCVEALLQAKAPIMVRNNAGRTPMDVAENFMTKWMFDNYILENRDVIYGDYAILQERARKRYSSADRITRVFVVGNTGAGKSSLVESLKRDGFFDGLVTVSVPAHTAGIIPSVYSSKICGRVSFFDFAGDPEYYSSHAAIIENFASTCKGDNIFIIVVDLRDDNEIIKSVLFYWLSFIKHQKFNQSPFTFFVGEPCR